MGDSDPQFVAQSVYGRFKPGEVPSGYRCSVERIAIGENRITLMEGFSPVVHCPSFVPQAAALAYCTYVPGPGIDQLTSFTWDDGGEAIDTRVSFCLARVNRQTVP